MAGMAPPGNDFFGKAAKFGAVGLAAIVGAVVFGLIGSLAYPVGGVGAIGGAALGAFVFFLIAFAATGAWKTFLPKDVQKYGPKAILPDFVLKTVRAPFTIILTVHQVDDLIVKGLMPWSKPDTYVEITCGMNPVKRSCVRQDGKFNEQFSLRIDPLDESILVQIKDQDVFGSTDIGYVALDITRDITGAGFPWKQSFEVNAWDNDKIAYAGEDKDPMLVLSFDHTEDIPGRLKNGQSYGTFRTQQSKDVEEARSGNKDFAAVQFLSNLEFNTQVKVVKQPQDGAVTKATSIRS